MQTTRISDYRSHLSHYHTQVIENHEPLRVVGAARGDVVVLPAQDFENLQETINILKDRATMNSLLENRSDYENRTVDGQEISEAFNDVMESQDK